ncbi:hypothetical protein HDU83_006399, partial [Entophlyctis luteolus]
MTTQFFVKYGDNYPVKIKTHYDTQGTRREDPLSDVADVIGAVKQVLAPRFDSTPVDELTLHLPSGVPRSALDEDCFMTIYESDTTLRFGMPLALKFIISATHSLKQGVESPVEFFDTSFQRMSYRDDEFKSFPTFNRQHFLLSETDAAVFLDSPIGLRNDMKFESLKQNIIAQCGGLIGALRLSVDGLTGAFAKSQPSETEAHLFYFSADVVSRMACVFGSDHSLPVDTVFKNFLVECPTSGLSKSPTGLSPTDDLCFTRLQKAGILVEEKGSIKFSSIMGEKLPGEIDFYLNGSLRWEVELLVEGRGIMEHTDRFGLNGKYFKLDVNDYIIVDFRSSQDGQPTQIQHDPKRISVFFKAGDYSACQYIFGLEQTPVMF